MNAPRQFDALERVTLPAGPVHLAIGMFDGVHRGHQAVIGAAVAAARATGGSAGVLTFWPHPAAVLRPGQPTRLIQTREAKRAALLRLGVDFLVEQPFTLEFARTGAQEFVAQLHRVFPGLVAISVGENFRFGRGREGDVSLLAAAARERGFEVRIAPRLEGDGEPVSSSRVRALIAAGDIAAANRLLGYTHHTDGVVGRGRQLGRTLGFPTLNLAWQSALHPPFGVYAVRVGDSAATARPGVANFGVRPTVDEAAAAPVLEVHLLDDAPAPNYGDTVRVWWLEHLRSEMKFPDLDALRRQIAADREMASRLLGKISAHEIPKSA